MNKIGFILLLVFSIQTMAAKYKGYPALTENKTLDYTENIDRILENKEEFLLLIHNYAAFYSFPKDKEHELEIRNYLNDRMKTKKKLIFQIDPVRAKILFISDQ